MRALCPGRARIHSKPANDQAAHIPEELLVQKANEALGPMNATVVGGPVTAQATLPKSGDVIFDSKNWIH